MNRYPKPAVSAVVINPEKKVLLTRRSPKVRAPGFWCLPGGHLDGGFDWVGAMRKEVFEEVGLTVLHEKLVGIYSDPTLHKIEEVVKGKTVTHFFLVASFLVTGYEGEVKINDEVDAFDWFDPQKLPAPLLPSEKIKIADVFEFAGQAFVR